MSPFVRALPTARCCLCHLSRCATRPVPTTARCLSSYNSRLRQQHRYISGSPIASRRNNDFNSGFSSSYDPSVDAGRGPMFNKTNFGVPQFYPRDLKKRVDDYVVGQDRAKKTICATIFNHYQNLRRRHQHEHEDRNRRDKVMRQRFARDRELHQKRREMHPVEDEFPGHNESVRALHDNHEFDDDPMDHLYVAEDITVPDHVKIDKSNLLLVGPTGVGKTYILETLSKKINVPFSICDCNSFTQAGYIGQDVETCIERLLIEANYDIKATEHGIVVLDEFDKIARRETTTGRDVGGEGVQQALLKLVEGTKVTINVKDNRSSRSTPPITTNYSASGPSSSTPQAAPPGGKVDQYTIDTTNILFVFCGAFVGLDKAVLKRVARPTMGFGGELRGRSSMSGNKQTLPAETYTHLPHHNPQSASSFTPLDLTTPADLQSFGFIPELIGRLHNICALSPLSKEDLLRILTEPKNSLVAQYTALFETYPSRLFFTEKSLYAIAERAAASETGARGLKMEMERVLAEPMFDAPMPYVLITEGCVKGTEKAGYWGKDGRFEVDRRMQAEEMNPAKGEPENTFEKYREAGQSGG
ncbi:ATP-dependent Clp protease ATP-binding subunit ClpX [Fusarium oxysporum f. sp. raphani 54005]|uniref:ATP-dependent Clp protease ATP-binding subunit ClpX n=5 Tax=Fusarium oxysporum TaxID=5507 RepID=X0BVV5_FUSOX|nr:ATP-dependent Clp protease ATP-binding subunit ClpX [Fusarium oxysporum f. sp. pisi HDV247]EXK86305.1 ATP-dependent Clp protease ATP-binding subunit ClpX [Fusarium oxysporum f. sp. raphani 54005]EXL79545.1 ATP-dependent Clp protease ATP-binding subunit ClpX [Fusarium oxysporum f. sp. conglutinans race 2 54008]EXM24967.1 ATP-dependent Clp protease ATP-binding subunit ClpX [Fusarium oxysporum f. sp. vasinfectum 25433]KAG6995116.1 ATP-dependent clpX-like chaperone [Fusarium oxysporum f. sp. con